MTVRVSADLTSACPRGCSGHGQCLQGQCQCSPGYIGQDCALSKYSVLFCLTKTVHLASGCSGHGQCLQGQCQCSPGYIGQDCALSKYSVLFCLTKSVHLASVAPGTVSAFRASASAAPDTSDRTVRSVSIQCFCLAIFS
jgi:hypothetical protein